MKKFILFLVLSTLLATLLISAPTSSAQTNPDDPDGDGVVGRSDLCPDVPGPAENDGCPYPDSDGDGTLDKDDGCPREAGPADNRGCPVAEPTDTDGDGITDTADRCPNEPGPASNNGCPEAQPPSPSDADGDGTPDSVDRCPNEGGPASNGGCPESQQQPPANPDNGNPDSDGDGVPDANDRCPDRAGPNDGCPLPRLPELGRCFLATLGGERVNIRMYPQLDAEIVGQLFPSEVVPVLGIHRIPAVGDPFVGDPTSIGDLLPAVRPEGITDGTVWFRIAKGWVFSEVVRLGGICNQPTPPPPPSNNENCQINAYSPSAWIEATTTYFKWTPIANADLAWYQLNLYLYDAVSQQMQWVGGFGKGASETFGNMDTSIATVGFGPQFRWQVVAYSMNETVLCESNVVSISRPTAPIVTHPPLESCEGFAGIMPMNQLGAMNTHFEWAMVPNATSYVLSIYDTANVYNYVTGDTFIDVPTDSASIGDGPTWTWQVEAFNLVPESLCTTELYTVTRKELDDSGAPVGNVEVDCGNFVGLIPGDGSVVLDLPLEVTFSWSPAAIANVNYYVRVYHEEGGASIGKPTLGDTVAKLFVDSTSSLGAGVDYWWDVAAYPADNPGGYGGYETALCVTPKMHYELEPVDWTVDTDPPPSRPDPGQPRPEGELPPNFIDLDLNDLCQNFIMVAFQDSATWSQFWWTPLAWADGYAVNIYDANQQFLTSYKTSANTQILVVDLGLGPQQNFWFNVDALSKNGNALCSMKPYFIERNFESQSPWGEISFDPNITVKPEPETCDTVQIISPIGYIEYKSVVDFNWVGIGGNTQYVVEISYKSWGPLTFKMLGATTLPLDYYFGGIPDAKSWRVLAFDGDALLCATDPVNITTNPLEVDPNGIVIPPGDLTVKPEGCAAFEAISPLEQFENIKPFDPLGQSNFEWTAMPGASVYQLSIYNADGNWVNGTWVNEYYPYTPYVSFATGDPYIGPGDKFSWDVVAYDSQGNIICKIDPAIEVTRPSQSPSGETSNNPELEGCTAFQAISPLQQFENITAINPLGESWFEWTQLVGTSIYQLNIYDADGNWVNGTFVNEYPQFNDNPVVSFATGDPYIGPGDNFKWDVVAFDSQSNIICQIEPPIEVTRPPAQ